MNSEKPLPSDLEPDDKPTSSRDAYRSLIIRSEDILQGRPEVWIEHGEEMYRLRTTSAGKLYLSK